MANAFPAPVVHHSIFGKMPYYYGIMNTTITIDKAGRVVIPKTVRDALHLEAGDSLELESDGDRVTLRPLRSASPLRKERGFWVFYGREPLSLADANKLIRDVREERARHALGEGS